MRTLILLSMVAVFSLGLAACSSNATVIERGTVSPPPPVVVN